MKSTTDKMVYIVEAMNANSDWTIGIFESKSRAEDLKDFLYKVVADKEKYREVFSDFCIDPLGSGSIANFFCVIENKLNDSFYTCVYCGKLAFFDLDGGRLCEDCYFTEQ